MKKEAYYFFHDSNAQDDPKCMLLIDELGMEGYGIFWALIERLRSEKSYQLPVQIITSFAKRWGTSKEKVENVLKDYGLFKINKNYFFSPRLKSTMEERTERARLSISARWKNTTVLQPNNDCNTDVIQNDTKREEEKRVKKKREEERRVKEVSPSFEEVKQYFSENKYTEESANKFFNYYSVEDWRDSKGNDVRSWKQKAQSVWFKEENLQRVHRKIYL